MIKLLLDPRLSRDAPGYYYRHLIAHAAFVGDQDLVEHCLTRSEQEGKRDQLCCPHANQGLIWRHSATFAGELILLFASQGAQTELVEFLLSRGVNQNAPWYFDYSDTPLKAAVDRGHLNVARLLVKYNPSEPTLGHKTRSILGRAAKRGFKAVAHLIIAHNCVLNLEHYDDQDTPAVIAIKFGQIEVLELLLANGGTFGRESLEDVLERTKRKGYVAIHQLLLTHSPKHCTSRSSQVKQRGSYRQEIADSLALVGFGFLPHVQI